MYYVSLLYTCFLENSSDELMLSNSHVNMVGTGQGKVREIRNQGKSQGILCWVREILDFEKSQGNTGKSLESQGNLTFSCHTRNAVNLNSLCVTIL